MMKYDMRAADKCPHSFCLQETDDLQETDGLQEIDGLQEMDDKNGGFVYNKKRKSKI